MLDVVGSGNYGNPIKQSKAPIVRISWKWPAAAAAPVPYPNGVAPQLAFASHVPKANSESVEVVIRELLENK